MNPGEEPGGLQSHIWGRKEAEAAAHTHVSFPSNCNYGGYEFYVLQQSFHPQNFQTEGNILNLCFPYMMPTGHYGGLLST